jgi:hypothetical protein
VARISTRDPQTAHANQAAFHALAHTYGRMHQTEELRPHGYAGASPNPLLKAHAIRNI